MSQNPQCHVWHVIESCNDHCDALPTDGMYNIDQVETMKARDFEVAYEPNGPKIYGLESLKNFAQGYA